MNNRTRKTAMMLAAVSLFTGIWTAGKTPAYGAGTPGDSAKLGTAQETEVVLPVTAGQKEVKTELTGTVEVSLISVTMPSDGFEFQLNPEGPFNAVTNPGGQIVCPDPSALKVTNHSVVPVRLEISEVAQLGKGDISFSEAFPGGPEQSFRLVEKISEVNRLGTAILVLGRAGMSYADNADFEQYAIYPGKTGIRIMDLEAGESAGLQLYGKAEGDFYGEYQFTVRPTLKISAVRAR